MRSKQIVSTSRRDSVMVMGIKAGILVALTATVTSFNHSGRRATNWRARATEGWPVPDVDRCWPARDGGVTIKMSSSAAWRNSFQLPIYLDRDGRSVRVDVQLGSLTRRLLIDTGATGLSIPESVAYRLLLRHEAVEAEEAMVMLANGSEERQRGVRILSLSIGGQLLRNVYATVAPDDAEPLLGFTVLNQVGRFTIDTNAGVLIIG